MAVVVDIKGVSRLSLKRSCWVGWGVMFGWTFVILLSTNFLAAMNVHAPIAVYIIHVFLDWHSVVAWTTWFNCLVWGAIALALPVRPRAPKRAALIFWLVLIGLHLVTHAVWITVFCKRCHTFFNNSLAGNIAKATIETFFEQSAKKAWVQDFLYVATPVANWISAPYIFRFYHQLPPLDIIFWSGWNWVIIAFAFGVLPMLSVAATIPIIMAYISAIDFGGNGTECVPPSKLELFYSLDIQDRMDIRAGEKRLEDCLPDYSGSRLSAQKDYSQSGTGSSNSPQPMRIPSYKPNRKIPKV